MDDGSHDSGSGWNEMDDFTPSPSEGKTQFLVAVPDDSTHSLHFPQEVGSHLRNMISLFVPVKLETSSGCVHDVEVRGEMGAIVLRSGWNGFMNAHHIEEDYSILFVYHGNNTFKVHIFDSSCHERSSSCSQPSSVILGAVPPHASCDHRLLNEQMVPLHLLRCEKPSSCFVVTNFSGTQETSADSVLILDPPPHQVKYLSSSNEDDMVREGTRKSCMAQKRVTRSSAKTEKLASTSSPYTESGPGAPKPRDRASLTLAVGSESLSTNIGGPFQCPYILSQGTTLPWQAVKKIEERVQAIRPKVPLFVKVMTNSSVHGHRNTCAMNFCSKYASAYLWGERRTLLLQLEGQQKQWETTMSVRKGKYIWIYQGWWEFARKNGLEVEDICLFQLASKNSTSLSMTVHLIRKSEMEPHDQTSVNLAVGSKYLPNNLGGSSQGRYIFAQRATLPLQMEMKVQEKVHGIRSQLPILVRLITTTNLDHPGRNRCEMAFSMEYACATCLPDKTQPLLLQLEGKSKLWHSTLSVTSRKQRQIYYGWKEFAEGNEMKAGDVCLFQVASSCNTGASLTMIVHLIRQ